MPRSRLRTWLIVGLGALLSLILLIVWMWPGPTYRTEVVVRERFAPSSGQPAPLRVARQEVRAPRVLVFDQVPLPLQRRLDWAHDRAAWTNTGWIACDVSGEVPAEANLAELVRDERGWVGPVDPASSSMLVVDGWLALAVTEPSGAAEVEVSAIFQPAVPLRLSWTDAVGEVPGRCHAAARDPRAVLQVEVVAAAGQAPPDPDEIIEIVGCGYTTEPGDRPALAAGPCAVHAQRRGALLPTQVAAGPPVIVEPSLLGPTPVTLALPPDPTDALPRLDETLLLLDVAAFSGAEVLADHLEVALDDLERGEVDLDHFAGFRESATGADTPDDVFEAIGATWEAWGSLDERAETDGGP